ncbi:heavy metal sensor histidine kinase [Candidatus Entotheonella palauensis]|uniref:heavy metal sensor histidine kinase n=1 Tax=Candidatus Entotheonella palauensis TaxID=93172 RepID=UPI000B7F6A66|nr:heavy metal sensor histidine kinase [Candidatus Entotheonella palauensis]
MFLKRVETQVAERHPYNIPSPSWSLTTLLAILTTLAAGGILLLALAIVHWSLDTHLHGSTTGFLSDEIRELQEVLHEDAHHTKPHLQEEVSHEVTSHWSTPYYVRLLRPNGDVVVETPGIPQFLTSAVFLAPIEINALTSTSGTKRHLPDGDLYRLINVLVDSPLDKQHRWHLQVALDVSAHKRIMANHRLQLGGLLLAGLLVSAGVGAMVAYTSLRPLRAITLAAQRITSQRLDERIAPSKWPRELMLLASAFDTMLDQLEDAFNRLSQFAGDLAHELRRPLQRLKGEAETALTHPAQLDDYQHILGTSLEEYEHMANTIDDLLFLARTANPRHEIAPEHLEGQGILYAMQSYFEALAEEQGIEIICEGKGRLYADPTLVRRALSNLLSNAIRYTPPQGTITLALYETSESATEISVRDTGCGIAPDHLPHVLNRFYQATPTHTPGQHHSGLGLAIVQSIMNVHDGQVNIESTLGTGTTVRLTFPRGDIEP